MWEGRLVAQVGIVQHLRSGPWVVPTPDGNDTYYVLHWASLIAGAKMAHDRDEAKANQAVQVSINNGLQDVCIFNKHTPRDVLVFLKAMGFICSTT